MHGSLLRKGYISVASIAKGKQQVNCSRQKPVPVIAVVQGLPLSYTLTVGALALTVSLKVLVNKTVTGPMRYGATIAFIAATLPLHMTGMPMAFWALVAVYGLYYGLTEGAEKALVTDFVPSDRRATAFGIYHGAIGLAALPASVMFGLLLDLAGRGVAFGIGAALAAVAAALLVVLLSTGKRLAPDGQ